MGSTLLSVICCVLRRVNPKQKCDLSPIYLNDPPPRVYRVNNETSEYTKATRIHPSQNKVHFSDLTEAYALSTVDMEKIIIYNLSNNMTSPCKLRGIRVVASTTDFLKKKTPETVCESLGACLPVNVCTEFSSNL